MVRVDDEEAGYMKRCTVAVQGKEISIIINIRNRVVSVKDTTTSLRHFHMDLEGKLGGVT